MKFIAAFSFALLALAPIAANAETLFCDANGCKPLSQMHDEASAKSEAEGEILVEAKAGTGGATLENPPEFIDHGAIKVTVTSARFIRSPRFK